MSNLEDELNRKNKELMFMYGKYEELCIAYKKLAQSKGLASHDAVHDMSNMTFQSDYK
jgi:hypothetical protein